VCFSPLTLWDQDNTLAGAQARLQKYKDFRAREGRGIFNEQIKVSLS
jgi:phage-related baseplate assembly protein